MKKCEIDIYIFNIITNYFGGIQKTLTDDGIHLYTKIVDEYIRIQNKWKPIVLKYTYRNQEYNFAQSKFLEIN